jgi:hypothetical protein
MCSLVGSPLCMGELLDERVGLSKPTATSIRMCILDMGRELLPSFLIHFSNQYYEFLGLTLDGLCSLF